MCLPDPDLGWLCCRPARSAPVLCALLTSLLSLHCQGEQGTPHTQQFHFTPSKKSFCPPPSLPPSTHFLPPRGNVVVPQPALLGAVHLPGFLQVHGGVITRGFILPATQNNTACSPEHKYSWGSPGKVQDCRVS